MENICLSAILMGVNIFMARLNSREYTQFELLPLFSHECINCYCKKLTSETEPSLPNSCHRESPRSSYQVFWRSFQTYM